MPYKDTLANPLCRTSIVGRIETLRPDSPRRWGKMTANQMVCHLTDSYLAVIGERKVSSAKLWVPRPILKWLILDAPMKWGKNVATMPEVEQGVGGTPPTDFDADVISLLKAIDRFCSAPDSVRGPHPIIGNLTHDEWMRWGYLHPDHHLRQFGV